MPKFPKAEFYAFRWFQWQAFGLAIYAALAWLNPSLFTKYSSFAVLTENSDFRSIFSAWFGTAYISQAIISIALTYRNFIIARRQAFAELEAYCLETYGTLTFRRDRTYVAGGVPKAAQDDPIPPPNLRAFAQLWALGLIPAALLTLIITEARSGFWLVAVCLLVVLTAGVSLIFMSMKRQHDRYQETAQPVLFSMTSLPPIPHHPPHNAAAAAEEAGWSSRANRYRINEEHDRKRAARLRTILPVLEAAHLKAFGRYVAERDFDGTIHRDVLRRDYVWFFLQDKPNELADLRYSTHPEIQALLSARGITSITQN